MNASVEIPVVGPREPCPCGSGKRYKVCHGKKAKAAGRRHVTRPFQGLPGECDWVALREIVSAATVPIRLRAPHADRDVVVATVLPGAYPALVRENGQVLLGLQTVTSSGDPSADLGHALSTALEAEPGAPVTVGPRPADAPRLQDLVAEESPFEVTVHEGFDFWTDPDSEPTAQESSLLESANEAVVPTARLSSAEAAYWCRLGDRDQVRWVLPYDEEPLLDALSRLHVRGDDVLAPGTRLLGTFRAHGLLVPVWDLPDGTEAAEVEEPVAAMEKRLAEAVADTTPLDGAQRRARAGLANRQVTIR
ncbi:DUF5926 family protein [Phytoactinopolyspora halotolerans]|uniref:Topoisomerase II n=1 Tax=Phytoactinopolyspora halotolerans TaxID=1981512 RepID=A0A6L9S489_9ACTN|nr:DUF5926 family protein [Phytoactinopolyspora halotolerans]NED98809.1 topoisomerase II [Phytoactinopolyspora halotolerans]